MDSEFVTSLRQELQDVNETILNLEDRRELLEDLLENFRKAETVKPILPTKPKAKPKKRSPIPSNGSIPEPETEAASA